MVYTKMSQPSMNLSTVFSMDFRRVPAFCMGPLLRGSDGGALGSPGSLLPLLPPVQNVFPQLPHQLWLKICNLFKPLPHVCPLTILKETIFYAPMVPCKYWSWDVSHVLKYLWNHIYIIGWFSSLSSLRRLRIIWGKAPNLVHICSPFTWHEV